MDSWLSALLIVALLLSVILLSVLNYRQSQTQTRFLTSMLKDRENLIQSLMNQLRTKDPFTLQTLNATTLTPSLVTSEPDYISMGDAAEAKRFSPGFGDELTQEDYEAFGDIIYEGTDR